MTGAPKVRGTHALLAEQFHRRGNARAAERHRAPGAESPAGVLWPDPYLEQVMNLETGSTALLLRAESFLAQERFDLTMAVAKRVVQLHPGRPEGHFLMWRLLVRQKDMAGAEAALAT